MAERVPARRLEAYVTGLGPVSAVGEGRDAYWEALCAGRPGFGPITLCDTTGCASQVGAEVTGFELARYVEHGERLAQGLPRPAQLALAAAVLCLHDAELDVDACDPERLGVWVGTSVGNFEALMGLRGALAATDTLPPNAPFHAIHHSIACTLTSVLNMRGPVATVTSGCNSGLDALGQALRAIQAGALDAALVVGTDCELVPEVIRGLEASGSLTTRWNAEPERASRPFDRDRDGNVIGEGACALLVESQPFALYRRARVYARLAGYHCAAAGYGRQYRHADPDLDLRPARRALEGALAEAGWQPGDVELVNANGSSSVLYDPLEARALAAVFGERLGDVRVHSQKSMLGQHGAGSSALQAASACLAIRRGGVPPTINHEHPGDDDCARLRLVTRPDPFQPERVLVHSIGLGGFYHSAAAFEVPEPRGADDPNLTGLQQVRWSEGSHRRFRPSHEFQGAVPRWTPANEALRDDPVTEGW